MPDPTDAPAGTPAAGATGPQPAGATAPAAPPPGATGAGGGTSQTVLGHGGPIPPDRVSNIRARAEGRARSATLKEIYGTDDPVRIQEIQRQRQQFEEQARQRDEEYKRLRQAEEERQRASMTEQERLKADLDKANLQLKERDDRIRALEEGRAVQEQDVRVSGIAADYVHPGMMDAARLLFGSYVNSLTDKQVEALTQRDIEKWFRDLVKKQPRYAKDEGPTGPKSDASKAGGTGATAAGATAAGGTAAAAPRRRVLMTTGNAKVGGRVEQTERGGSTEGKTPRPGQPNSMSGPELREHLKKQGLRPWS